MCTHVWEIDNAEQGVCKLCHRTKDFRQLLYKDGFYSKGLPSRVQYEDCEFMSSWGRKCKYAYPVQGSLGMRSIEKYGIYDDS